MQKTNRVGRLLLNPWIGLIVVALVTRLIAVYWNADRLFGDVNLFAIAAQQWQETGKLEYPGKYDYSEKAAYLALTSPASQHPPAWSWLGGNLATLLGTSRTYFALQIWSLIGGMLLVSAGMWLGVLLGGKRAALICGGALALHPYLIDYSANGSPYLWIGLAAFVVLSSTLDKRLNPVAAGALAGLATGVAASVHGAGIALLPFGLVALLASQTENKFRRSAAYVVTAGMVLLPTCLWMHAQFGQWWHTNTTDYVFGKLGLISRIHDELGIRVVRGEMDLEHYAEALVLAAGSSLRYARYLACELGWLGVAGVAAGAAVLFRNPETGTRTWLVFLLLILGVGLPCWLWPSFKFRFLAGLLPLCVWLAAFAAARAERIPRWAGPAILGIAGFWAAQWIATGSPAKYYAFDLDHRRDYAAMRDAARVLESRPPGSVLTFTRVLDGGVEAAYWHGQKIIAARGFTVADLLRLNADFSPDYALVPPARRAVIEDNFPHAILLHEGAAHLVYSLRP
jgi:hypothetical protein